MSTRADWMAGAVLAMAALAPVLTSGPAAATSFSFSQIAGDTLTAEQSAAFGQAAAAWSAVLTDPVEVRLDIGFRDLGSNASGALLLGQSLPSLEFGDYAAFRSGLAERATSAADTNALAALPGAAPGDRVLLTNAQARAVGLTAGDGADASIEFTSNGQVSFAAARAGMSSTAFDLVGVAEHEIGHALGFISGLDGGSALDGGTTLDLDPAARSALDLFRYAAPGTPGFAAGQAAYFSLDNGATSLGEFSVGGPGQAQASHWLDGLGGLLGPSLAPGVVRDITARDLTALDVVGWTVAAEGGAPGDGTVVPEPASAALLLAGLGMLAAWWRGRA